MKITCKMTLKDYDQICRKKYPKKIPDWHSRSFRRLVGDCIYDYSEGRKPKLREGIHNQENRRRDLRGKFVLLSTHFYYFGAKPRKLPMSLQKIIKRGQGHKSKSNDRYLGKFQDWIQKFTQNRLYGEPQLKQKIMNEKDFASKCAEHRRKEADADERIKTKQE